MISAWKEQREIQKYSNKKVDTLVQEMCNENCSYFISPSTTLHRHTILLSWRPGKDLAVLTWAERDNSVVEWMWALDAKYLLGRVLLQKDFDQNGEEILHQPHHLVDAECLQVVGTVKSWRQARRKNYWKSATGWAQRRCFDTIIRCNCFILNTILFSYDRKSK